MLDLKRNTEKASFLQEDIWPNESRKKRRKNYLCVDGNNLPERAHSSVGGGRHSIDGSTGPKEGQAHHRGPWHSWVFLEKRAEVAQCPLWGLLEGSLQGAPLNPSGFGFLALELK